MALFADAREGAGQREEDDFPTGEELLERRAGEACAGRVSTAVLSRRRARPAGGAPWAKEAATAATAH